jgi:hypothetical protein
MADKSYDETYAAWVDEWLAYLQVQMTKANLLAEEQVADGRTLMAVVTAVNERAGSKGAPEEAKRALDEATWLVGSINEGAAKISEEVVDANRQIGVARNGMKPALEAEDILRQARAHGDIVQTATD